MSSPVNSISPNRENILFNRKINKRASPRRPADDLAQIQFDQQMIGCLIHNISADGAMLEVSTSQVPDRFILSNYKTGHRMICKVIWRDHLKMGVKFISKPKSFHQGFK